MRKWLKELREKAGFSQQSIAEQLGISQNYYSMIETGERQSKMTIDTAQKLANVFDVSIEVILKNENKAQRGQAITKEEESERGGEYVYKYFRNTKRNSRSYNRNTRTAKRICP